MERPWAQKIDNAENGLKRNKTLMMHTEPFVDVINVDSYALAMMSCGNNDRVGREQGVTLTRMSVTIIE